MKYIKTFESYKNSKLEPINEEFVLGMIKGALGKLMQSFGKTFKDIANDFKNAFKEDDPNSIKGIIMDNFNQAIDGAQKLINDKEVDEAGVTDLMNKFIGSLVQLGGNIGKDIDSAIGKEKVDVAKGAKEIAKAIILGNKEAKWPGIVGLLDPNNQSNISGVKDTNFKWSKIAYSKAIGNAPDLKSKKAVAIKFIDNMQKDVTKQLDDEFTEEEITKLYNDAKGGKGSGLSYEKLKELYDNKTPVLYLLKDKTMDDWNKLSDIDKTKPDQKPASDVVGLKVMDTLNDKGGLSFKSEKGEIIQKKYEDIIEFTNTKVEGQDDLVNTLKDVKAKNAEAIPKIDKFSKLYADPEGNKDIINKIEDILPK